ncbi:MAG: transglutaminase domain-containing protein [Victivallales bacterium]|nr:transglutaminase domain-containing protein [Victivallales bacterium]
MFKKLKKNDLNKIIDTSRQLKEPQRLPFHWLYLAYFGGALVCSMWQHAHPILTMVLLLLLFPVGALAYVPYKYFSSRKRFIGQLIFIFLGAAWCVLRLKMRIPVDKVLVELLSIITFCFIIAQRYGDYDYLLLASIFLFLYGALLPRVIFLIAFFIGAVLCAVLLYSTRLRSISRQLDLENPPRFFARSWPQYLVHLLLTFGICYYIFSLLPSRENEGEGLIPTSFLTDNELRLPPTFRKWFSRSSSDRKSPDGDFETSSGSPTNAGKSGIPIKMKSDQAMSTPGKNGSGSPGKELIFRVKSPVKLYWMAQIYDVYDGDKWTFTRLSRYNNMRKFIEFESRKTDFSVETKFVIEKWLSPKLYFAYRPVCFDTFNDRHGIINYKESVFNTVLTEKIYPALPFTYHVVTSISIPRLDRRRRIISKITDSWTDIFKPGHYLRLPQRKISPRVRRLVGNLLSGIDDPYRKALRLRDYLRTNYKYKLYSRPVPKGQETVDYFLFKLREGHCEYFASSLAVMARLAGLPARVATGFSPGNYNALNKYFEVHAYHAHAWTQIYVPGMGWLTMDATPPGSIESRTTPFGIGSMRDPFGDSWRVTPPEVTPQTIAYLREKYYEKFKNSFGKLSPYEEFLLATADAQNTAEMKLNACLSDMQAYKERGLERLKLIFARIKDAFRNFSDFAVEMLKDLLEFLCRNWFILIPIIVIFIAIFLEIMILKRYFKRALGLRKSRIYYTAARNNFPGNPGKSVRMCYYVTRSLLNLGGFPRPRNAELFDYGQSLGLIDAAFHRHVVVIFYMFSKLEYSAESISRDEAEDTLARLEKVREFIYPLIHETSELKRNLKI